MDGRRNKRGCSSSSSPQSSRYVPSNMQATYRPHVSDPQKQLRYSEVLLSGVYKTNGESALRALEQAEMISIQSMHGRPHSIRPGRPVYASAFRALIADRVLRARLELSTLNELTKSENSTVEKCEAELSLLGNLPEKGGGLLERMLYLMDKLKKSHRSIEEYEAESSKLKKILQTET